MLRTRHTPLSQSLCSRYVQVESWANRLHVARIGSYSGWPPLRCVSTASSPSRTIVVQGRLHLRTSCGLLAGAAVTFLSVTLARETTFARSMRNNWISKRDGYIHTYIQTISKMRRRISFLALRRLAISGFANMHSLVMHFITT